MEIVCENCNTSHYLSDDKIPLETKTGKCKKCGAAITVLGKNEANNFNAKESLKMAITQPEFEGTNVRQFLAHKGSIIIKEFRRIARLTSNYYDYSYDDKAYKKAEAKADLSAFKNLRQGKNPIIIVSTLILGIIKGKDQQTIFGVKLEHIGTDEYSDETTVFISI